MSFRKVSPGTRFKQSPAYTAAWQNAVTDATKYYQEQIQLGKGGDSQPGVSRPPKIRNTTESDLLRGHAVQLGDYLLDPLDHRCLWFEGKLYDGGILAIVREATPIDKIGPVQLSGETTVLVDVTDTNHTHATPETGELVLKSSESGPLLLLQRPESTGEQELAAIFEPPAKRPDELRGIINGYIPPATSGNTYGLVSLKTSPAPIPLPTGTPALSGTIVVADVHGLGAIAFPENGLIRAIKNVGVDTLGADQIDWEHLPTEAAAGAKIVTVSNGHPSHDGGEPVTTLTGYWSGAIGAQPIWIELLDDQLHKSSGLTFPNDLFWLPAFAKLIGVPNGTYDPDPGGEGSDERPLYKVQHPHWGLTPGYVGTGGMTAADYSFVDDPTFGTGEVKLYNRDNAGDTTVSDLIDAKNLLERPLAANTKVFVSITPIGLCVLEAEGGDALIAKITSTVSAKSGDTYGTGTANLGHPVDGEWTMLEEDVEVLNPSNLPINLPSGKSIHLPVDLINGEWVLSAPLELLSLAGWMENLDQHIARCADGLPEWKNKAPLVDFRITSEFEFEVLASCGDWVTKHTGEECEEE